MEKYIVGGFVRDTLMGEQPHDKDWVVVGSSVSEMLASGFKQVGHDFPVFLSPEGEEHALARTETRTGVGYCGFTTETNGVSLVDDLSRRDLTINSMAMRNDTIIDPFGGRQDLSAKVLRHTASAFSEDPLRILRVARFAARYPEFTIAEETMVLMRTMVARGDLEHLGCERIWKEIEKSFRTQRPSRFFQVLRDCGALTIILPEVSALIDVPQPEQHHPEGCAFTHTMMAVDVSAQSGFGEYVTFATLMHDVGKAITPEHEWPKHHKHEERGVPLVDKVCDRFRVSRKYRSLAVNVTRDHLRCHLLSSMTPGKTVDLIQRIGGVHAHTEIRDFGHACYADKRGRGTAKEYRNHTLLLEIVAAMRKVDMRSVTAGVSGEERKNKVRHAYCEAVAAARNT